MKKQIFLFILLLSCFSSSNGQGLAEQAKKDLVENSKFGGFVIGRAAFNDRDLSGANKYHSNFDLRLVRGYVDGKILNFQYKLQLEYEGYGGASEKGPHIVDAWGEWQKFKFFRIKLGQFKRCFTFENPTNPWDISFGGYSQLSDKLAGMNDRIGEHSSGGRDGGVQIQGDLLPSRKDGHGFVHYQIGLFNGQGINHNDVNNHKDLIGNIAICPIKDLSIAFFGWHGKYTSNNITVDRNRMAWGVKYAGPFTVRVEYGVSEGHKISDYAAPGVLNPTQATKPTPGMPWQPFLSQKTRSSKFRANGMFTAMARPGQRQNASMPLVLNTISPRTSNYKETIPSLATGAPLSTATTTLSTCNSTGAGRIFPA